MGGTMADNVAPDKGDIERLRKKLDLLHNLRQRASFCACSAFAVRMYVYVHLRFHDPHNHKTSIPLAWL
jgi:hypothetical protein